MTKVKRQWYNKNPPKKERFLISTEKKVKKTSKKGLTSGAVSDILFRRQPRRLGGKILEN